MTLIHATGTSKTHYLAERATITAQISVRSTDRSESIAQATRIHNWAVLRAEELHENGDATWHSADPLTTWAGSRYDDGAQNKSVVEHTTWGTVRIKLSNLELVGELTAELGEAGLSTTVDWSLTDVFRRDCERQARRAAVAEARAVADDYAEALGVGIVSIVSISDSSELEDFPQPRFALASFEAAGDFAPAEVSVAEITVSASVAGVYETD